MPGAALRAIKLPVSLMLVLSALPISRVCSPQSGSKPEQAHKDRSFTEFCRRTSGWTAGDGAVSVPLSDGRVLWLFGDSHVDDYDQATGTMPCLFQVRNAGLVQQAELRGEKGEGRSRKAEAQIVARKP